MRLAARLLMTCLLAAAPRAVAAAVRPVVVELFTAQGCSSCAKANAFIGRLADRPGVIALTWPVDYWDYLGWKDTFAQPAFTERQKAYERHFDLRDVYTPQVIVGGGAQASGDDAAAVEALVRKARRAPSRAPDIEFRSGDRVAIGSGRGPPGGADVWLVRFDPAEQDVEVKSGDNRGASVPHRDVVRQLVRLGPWSGRPVMFRTPSAPEEGLGALVIVQGAHGGPILGALIGGGPKS